METGLAAYTIEALVLRSIVLTGKMTLLNNDFENTFKDSYDPFFIAIGYLVQGLDFSGLHPNEDETLDESVDSLLRICK